MEQRIRFGDRLRRERRDRGRLGQRGRADGVVSRQAVHRALQLLGTSSQPSRHPVIAKYFEKLFTTIDSRDVSHAQLASGAPS